MAITQLTYGLIKGYVHNWLAAGPQVMPVSNIEGKIDSDLKTRIVSQYHQKKSGITRDPVECGPLSEARFTIGDYEGAWTYVRCQEDHFVDHSAAYRQLAYVRSWAFTELVSDEAQEALLILTTNGPANLWLNGKLVHRHEHFQASNPKSAEFNISLVSGLNKILVQFEAVGSGDCPNLLALRVCQTNETRDPIEGVHVEIPTLIQAIERRNELEESFETAYVNRDNFTRDDKIAVCWPGDLEKNVFTDVRLEAADGMTYAQAEVNGKAGDELFLSYGSQLHTGRYKAFLMPRAWEYYERDIRVSKEIPFWVIGNNQFSTSAYGTFQDRRQEVWQHASRIKDNIYSEISRMALGMWQSIELETIRETVARVNRRESASNELLAGLFRMLHNFGSHPSFPKGLNKEIKACILGYQYGLDEAVSGESEQILLHTCEILAGQRYPDLAFTNNGETGRWHRKHGEKLALKWLQDRGTAGFSDWNSDKSLAKDLVALSLLVDFASDQEVGEMAAIVMDKLFYALALNSFQGVFAASSGRSTLTAVQGGYLQETSGVTRLMWGLGIYNQAIAAPVSLACTKQYELPLILIDIALATPEGLWSREKHGVSSPDGMRNISISTYRTPDGLLSSAQDYHPGQPGRAEHIWQATLGPGATVFANHPANSSRNDSAAPNYWLGNQVLPRVGQWADTLIAVHALPEDDWMGFTHAYFPTFAFDEYVIREGWAFARKGNGYLALTASSGIQLVGQGREAFRELRSPGPNAVWVCQIGRALQDKDFANFQEKVLAKKVVFEDLSVRLETIRGDELSFGWEGPFQLNSQELALEGEKHYDSLFGVADFPSTTMEIQFGDRLLRLNLSPSDERGDVS